MTGTGILRDRPYWNKFMVLVSLILIFTVLATMLGFIIGYFHFGIDLRKPDALSDLSAPMVISLLKTMQILTQFGMFIFPSLLIAWLVSGTIWKYFDLHKTPGSIPILSCLLLILCSTPLVNWMVMINESMALPESLSFIENYFREMEDKAAELTEAFLGVITWKGLLINLIMIALIPAIGEELLFRGIIQRWLKDMTGNVHLGILLAAAIFSAIHFQFYGFLPRMVFGIIFGYMYVWSGSLWLPIIAHFVNNAAAVTLAYLDNKGKLPFDQDEIGTGPNEWIFLIGSIFAVVILGFFLRNYYRKSVNTS